ncbi:lasso peptide biosynthesis PqqD family chaperone [Streptomyces sp. enrichment culture]|uniref:lasso peptide biosynthesis PqqD family chaperone n=1 Tax=Streptomyces sp. enrichment culture TaxID=1795815 RepID=UPI003F56DF5A
MAVRLRDHVSLAPTEDGLALLDEDSGAYWSLNPTGAVVLRTLLDGGTSVEATRRIAEEYAVDTGTARHDVDELVAALRSAGLIVPAPGGP